jgi:hypothetical protein
VSEDSIESFHGWKVLGKTEIQGRTLKLLVEAFKKCAKIRKTDPFTRYACFNPRHGIRVIVDDQIYDLVVCFECHEVQAYSGKPEKMAHFEMKTGPVDLFNKILKDANVKLPKQPKH